VEGDVALLVGQAVLLVEQPLLGLPVPLARCQGRGQGEGRRRRIPPGAGGGPGAGVGGRRGRRGEGASLDFLDERSVPVQKRIWC